VRGKEREADNQRKRGTGRSYHSLLAWREAIVLVKEVYELTKGFPSSEMYGLTSQMRRASVSVPSNIAEGAARKGDVEFLQFLSISRGSLSELETQIIISCELRFISDNTAIISQLEKVFGLIGGLMNSIRKREHK